MRIYELSKILNVSSKEVIKVARDEFEIQGLKSHMSSVSELQAAKIQKYYIKGKESRRPAVAADKPGTDGVATIVADENIFLLVIGQGDIT
ncbi:MAG: translation initiation factor IF-2 N-terminal domain-containing protein, partial [Eubacteriales bacterium]